MVSIRESSTNLGSADNIANKIGEVLVEFMGKWFDKDAITKIYNTQSYDTYTGKFKVDKKNDYLYVAALPLLTGFICLGFWYMRWYTVMLASNKPNVVTSFSLSTSTKFYFQDFRY